MKHANKAQGRGRQRKRALTPKRVVAALKQRLYEDVRDVVMSKELVDEGYVPKTGMRAIAGGRQEVLRFCQASAETRRERAKCLSYLDNDYRGVFAEVDGEIVGHIWWCDHLLQPEHIHPQMVRYGLELQPGDVWSFDLYLLPEHRGKGAANDFFALFRAHLREAGYTRVYGHVESANLPAVWLHKMQGYRPVKTVEGQLFCGSLLWSEGRLFVRNPPIGVKQKFDFRALW